MVCTYVPSSCSRLRTARKESVTGTAPVWLVQCVAIGLAVGWLTADKSNRDGLEEALADGVGKLEHFACGGRIKIM